MSSTYPTDTSYLIIWTGPHIKPSPQDTTTYPPTPSPSPLNTTYHHRTSTSFAHTLDSLRAQFEHDKAQLAAENHLAPLSFKQRMKSHDALEMQRENLRLRARIKELKSELRLDKTGQELDKLSERVGVLEGQLKKLAKELKGKGKGEKGKRAGDVREEVNEGPVRSGKRKCKVSARLAESEMSAGFLRRK